MISNKFTIYTRGQRAIFRILDVIQLTLGLSIVGLIIWAMINTQDSINVGTVVMGLAAIISLVEYISRKIFNKHSFLHKILLELYKSNRKLYTPTPMQAEVCAWITTRIRNGNGIIIYGKPNTGKTSSVFMFLAQDTKDIDLLKNINWDESIIYIDCKNEKSDIWDFFCVQGKKSNREFYENSLIIIDNLEVMGKTFLENLLNIINSSLGRFILLTDVCYLDNDFYVTLERKCMRNNFTLSISESDNFKNIYSKLTDSEKKVLLVIYYISLSLTLIQVKDIYTIFSEDICFLHFKFILSSLLRKKLINFFPFDHSYVLMAKRMDMAKYQSVIWETQQNLDAVNKVLLNSEKFPESAWLSLVHLPYEQIKHISIGKREQLFSDALKSGNYATLCKMLLEELRYSPIKEDVFLYEAGTLYFFNSQQENAFKKYNILIERESAIDKQNRVMLRVIEATHGDVNPTTQGNINSYLRKLENGNYEYRLYAEYWKLHIETEKGFFLLDKYETLLENLVAYKDSTQDEQIYLEIVKRCYTDIIRSYHILKRSLSPQIATDFMLFLNENYNRNIGMIRYYNSLYIKANTLHYIDLLNAILEYKSCQDTYERALIEYNQAIDSGYENYKSVSACELKCIDLKLYFDENITEFQDYEIKIKTFLSNAEINRVSVHVAYCKTLLAKLYMIHNLYDVDYRKLTNRKSKDSIIKAYLREAKKIYKEYHNDYGTVRIDILESLYRIATISDRKELERTVQRMTDILEKHQEYQREKNIIQFYENILNNNTSFGMLAISILKAYPIIMQ